MQRLTVLFFIIFTPSFVYAQNSSQFNIKISDSTNLAYSIKNLTEEQFENSITDLTQEQHNYDLKPPNDSLLNKLNNILVLDSCIMITERGKELKLCNKKGNCYKCGELFRVLDYNCDNLIIQNGGYEWWRYIIVSNTDYFVLPDKPIFVDCKRVYSYGNYYTDGQFEYRDLSSKKKLHFDTFDWMIEFCYRMSNTFYFEFSSPNKIRERKFVALTIE